MVSLLGAGAIKQLHVLPENSSRAGGQRNYAIAALGRGGGVIILHIIAPRGGE